MRIVLYLKTNYNVNLLFAFFTPFFRETPHLVEVKIFSTIFFGFVENFLSRTWFCVAFNAFVWYNIKE